MICNLEDNLKDNFDKRYTETLESVVDQIWHQKNTYSFKFTFSHIYKKNKYYVSMCIIYNFAEWDNIIFVDDIEYSISFIDNKNKLHSYYGVGNRTRNLRGFSSRDNLYRRFKNDINHFIKIKGLNGIEEKIKKTDKK